MKILILDILETMFLNYSQYNGILSKMMIAKKTNKKNYQKIYG